MRNSIDTQGGIVKGGVYAPLHVQSTQKWELFLEVPIFAFKVSTLCRQLESASEATQIQPVDKVKKRKGLTEFFASEGEK